MISPVEFENRSLGSGTSSPSKSVAEALTLQTYSTDSRL